MSPLVSVVVIDDSPLSAEVLRTVIEVDPRLRVVAIGHDGLRAVELSRTHRPSVITMDVHMPGMNGLEAVRRIMASSPTRIILVTEDTSQALAFEALRRGALDLVRRPPGRGAFGEAAQRDLRQRILLLAQQPLAGQRPKPVAQRNSPGPEPVRRSAPQVVGVAASSGGPAALAAFLTALGPSFPLPILMVQHLAAGFVKGLAAWLQQVSGLVTEVAVAGLALKGGHVILAPDDAHLGVDRHGRVRLDRGHPIDGHLPSASHLFASLAEVYRDAAVAVVLTGMGRDGADGVSVLARSGARILVQDEDSSAVFGMPRAAAAADPTAFLGSPEALGHRLAALVSPRPNGGST